MANATLSPEVTDILSRSTITETLLILPEGQLDRKLYEQVAKAIKLAGGVWKAAKKGFLFTSDPRALFGLALEKGIVVDTKQLRQAFYTPPAVADVIALQPAVDGLDVLEPSAGGGALADACERCGASHVDCIELEESCRDRLVSQGYPTTIGDFLRMTPAQNYDRVVMNPPFQKSQDLKHITHALKWLRKGGQLFSIVPDKDCPKLAALGAVTVAQFPVGAFKVSGTSIATRLIRIAA